MKAKVAKNWKKKHSKPWFRSRYLRVMSPTRFLCASLLVIKFSARFMLYHRLINLLSIVAVPSFLRTELCDRIDSESGPYYALPRIKFTWRSDLVLA